MSNFHQRNLLKSWRRIISQQSSSCFSLSTEDKDMLVTVCNVSMQLNGDVLAAFLSSYGVVEYCTLITSANGTAYGDYVFTVILDWSGFHAIPHTITYRDTTMMMVVEGRRPLCWACKQLRHFARSCPQKTATATTKTTTTVTTNATTTTTTTTVAESMNLETGDHSNKEVGGPR